MYSCKMGTSVDLAIHKPIREGMKLNVVDNIRIIL